LQAHLVPLQTGLRVRLARDKKPLKCLGNTGLHSFICLVALGLRLVGLKSVQIESLPFCLNALPRKKLADSAVTLP
jgi:hypothetical protein